MPELHTRTREATVLQYGVYSSLGVWLDNINGFTYPGVLFSVIQGVRFQIHNDMTLERPRIRTLTLTFSVVDSGVDPLILGAVAVAIENNQATAVLSAANPPELPIGDLTGTGWVYFGTDDGTGWTPAAAPSTISIPLGTLVTDPVTGTTLYDLSDNPFPLLLEHTATNGILNMSIVVDTGPGDTAVEHQGLVLDIEELDFFTGVAGAKAREREGSRSRIVRDSRFGMPTWSDELVENEFNEGLWVRASDWDYEDPQREYTGNPREGVRDDDVPLE